MVTFCTKCGASLPLADVTIQDGREFTSIDYVCTCCGRPAAPEKASPPLQTSIEASEVVDLVIRSGREVKEKPPGR